MKEANSNHQVSLGKKKKQIILGAIVAVFFAGFLFFFTYFDVEHVEVMGSTYYSDEEIKKMVLKGAGASNSMLAPALLSKEESKDVPFIDGYTVTRLSRNTICISVKEKKPVGCIPYLDSYVYFDRNGIFIEGSKVRDETVPYFDGIQVAHVIKGEKIPIKGNTILNTAVALATIFQKNGTIPDHIQFDNSYQLSLVYGDVVVSLGKDVYLEDKMARVFAILPLIEGKKGILHLESVTDNVKTITFEQEKVEITAENWNGGYDENGDYTGYGEYDENGNHVGPKPMTELDYALQNWYGGYDGEGDYTGEGEYDQYGNYVGPRPTQEMIDAYGDWHGGYMEDGSFIGYGEFDREGNYVGPNPNEAEGSDESGYDESGYDESGYDESGYDESGYDDGSGYDDSWE